MNDWHLYIDKEWKKSYKTIEDATEAASDGNVRWQEGLRHVLHEQGNAQKIGISGRNWPNGKWVGIYNTEAAKEIEARKNGDNT